MTVSNEEARAYAQRLAARSHASGDITGWFETLYAEAEQGRTSVPWDGAEPTPRLVSALADVVSEGRALVIGCGLGEDAEYVASLGYATTAFDISPTAIAGARRRFPGSTVDYLTADLLSPPPSWAGSFDLVVEIYTIQVLTGTARQTAFARTAEMVAPSGRLLVIAGAREEHDDPGLMPWPLTRAEIESFVEHGLRRDSVVEFIDHTNHRSVRRWQAWFTARPADQHRTRPLTDG